MNCPHTACIFRSLKDEEREPLCSLCHVKRYAKGQCLREGYWSNCFSVMLKGLALEIEQSENHHPVTVGLNTAGSIMSYEELFARESDHGIDDFKDTLCATDCTVAVFRAADINALAEENPRLMRLILEQCVTQKLEEERNLLRYLGFGSATESIRFIIEYLIAHGVDYLTHEQIALICNRSRQTVTSTIKRLQDADPELFSGL